MSKIAKRDKNIEQVVKFMRDFVNDEEILDIYDKINDVKYYAKEEGYTEGFAEGYAESLVESKKEIAKKMLQNRYDINKIMEYTGLSINEIKELN